MADPTELATLKLSDFEPHLGSAFTVPLAEGRLTMTLDEAAAAGVGERAGGAFSLLFLGPPGEYLPQAIYPLDHPALGRLDLFLVPLGPDERGHRYQAVFA